MAEPPRDPSPAITVLVLEDTGIRDVIGVKIPAYGIEVYGEDLPALIEDAEEDLWWQLKSGGNPVPEAATLAIKHVTKEEFGPTCYELRAEELDWAEDE